MDLDVVNIKGVALSQSRVSLKASGSKSNETGFLIFFFELALIYLDSYLNV